MSYSLFFYGHLICTNYRFYRQCNYRTGIMSYLFIYLFIYYLFIYLFIY